MPPEAKTVIHWSLTLEESSRRCAAFAAAAAARAIAAKGYFTLVLAGGSTPERLYERLAQEPYRSAVDWNRVQVLWGDERCVGPEHEDSNYRLAAETLLHRVAIPPQQIFPMPGTVEPDAGARRYEALVRDLFQRFQTFGFDLVLLGVGADGHTASLFPGDRIVGEKDRLVAAVRPPSYIRPALPRLTMTLPLLNRSREIFFLISGPEKGEVAAAVFDKSAQAWDFPAALVRPQGGCRWFISACPRELFPPEMVK
jgi:6-phosphogluconolactonase